MYVFLDVDGVLNTEEDWSRKVYSLNDHCVTAFLRLLENLPEPHIVLSSSWRTGIANDGTTAVHVEDILRALAPAGIHQMDKTGFSPDGSRSKEIDHYLIRHPADSYLILDDDPQLFALKDKTPRLYLTDAHKGLTDKDVDKILKLIKRWK